MRIVKKVTIVTSCKQKVEYFINNPGNEEELDKFLCSLDDSIFMVAIKRLAHSNEKDLNKLQHIFDRLQLLCACNITCPEFDAFDKCSTLEEINLLYVKIKDTPEYIAYRKQLDEWHEVVEQKQHELVEANDPLVYWSTKSEQEQWDILEGIECE